MGKNLFTGRLRIALVLAILTIAPLISEFLLGNAPVNDNSPKVSGYLSLFLYLVLMFVVSHVNLQHIYVSTYPKNDYCCAYSAPPPPLNPPLIISVKMKLRIRLMQLRFGDLVNILVHLENNLICKSYNFH